MQCLALRRGAVAYLLRDTGKYRQADSSRPPSVGLALRENLRTTNETTGWPKNWHHFLCALTLPNIKNDFQNYFTVRIRRKCLITLSLKIPPHIITKDPTTPQVCRYTTL